MAKEKVFIQIDGNNFYHRLKEMELKNLLSFDYKKLADFILNRNDKDLVLAKYYIGTIREEAGNATSKTLMIGQQKLLGNIQKQGWQVGLGNMLKTDVYHEKGVDVLMAVDMLVAAYENLCDKIILISSDTDLLPAIDKTKALGKIVEYIGFFHKSSHAMIDRCSSSFLLRKSDLEGCLESPKN